MQASYAAQADDTGRNFPVGATADCLRVLAQHARIHRRLVRAGETLYRAGEQRGLRTDQMTLRMTRAEIGSYLGLTLESVSRAFTRLAREGHISFCGKGRRDVSIPSVESLARFVQRMLVPVPAGVLQ